MDEELRKAIERHSAGATVVHKGRFADLETFLNEERLEKKLIDRFVIPIYQRLAPLHSYKEDVMKATLAIRHDASPNVSKQLLGDFNWRTRSTGAYFAAVFDFKEFEENIGRLLLKSEVCYAGKIYALALALFNTKRSTQFLDQYLDYYLQQPQLYFDQSDVMGALLYLDAENCTEEALKHESHWKQFMGTRDEHHRTAEAALEWFCLEMEALKEIKATVNKA